LYSGEKDTNATNVKRLEDANIRILKLIGGTIAKAKELKSILVNENIEFLFNYLTKPNVIGAIVGKKTGVKCIYNGIRNSRIDWWKLILERLAHNHYATATIYNCYSGEVYFSSKGLKEGKGIVIPNCFPNIAEPIIREDKEIKHIVTVGRFVPQKDYKTIIRTIADLKKLRKDFVMDIIGYGDEEQNIRDWIKEYGVEEYINIYIRPNNVQDIVRSSDIYLSTSLFEGTSNSIMEALNWSLPVVASNVGDNDHLVIDGKNGSLHHIGDASGMALSLSKLLDSVKLRNKFGYESNQNLRNNYSVDIFEERYLKLIEG
jgi:glycosyltransferase involved in cell wall biosynthesis